MIRYTKHAIDRRWERFEDRQMPEINASLMQALVKHGFKQVRLVKQGVTYCLQVDGGDIVVKTVF